MHSISRAPGQKPKARRTSKPRIEARGSTREQGKDGADELALQSTAEALLWAARDEFAEHGFAGTDSNKIARRAGFAPQTFYRWYKDKTQIFIALYRRWEDDERALIEGQLAARNAARALAEAVVEHHREHLLFRRSLRQLSVSDPEVRAARAASRTRQAERIRVWTERDKRKLPEIYLALFEMERLADAVAEGELADLELGDELGLAAIERVIKRLRS
jgi:AcrR family transcriptional regulator